MGLTFRGEEAAPVPPPKPVRMQEYSELLGEDEKAALEREERLRREQEKQKLEEESPLHFIVKEDTTEKMILFTVTMGIAVVVGLFFYYITFSPWYMPWWMFLVFGGEHTFLNGQVLGSINEVSFTGLPLTLAHRIETGWNVGASCALIVDGDEYINVAGGGLYDVSDLDYNIKTLQVVFSSGKIFETIGMALLHDRGLLDIREPVAKYWPEFAQNGKESITVEQILSHRSGLGLAFNKLPDMDTLHDPDKLAKLLAAEHPLAPVGTVLYSGWFSALYISEICRRVDPKGRSLLKLIQEDVIADIEGGELYSGPVPEEVKPRISPIHEMPWLFWLFGFLPQIKLPHWFATTLFDDESKMTLSQPEIHMISQMMKHEPPYHNLSVPFMHIYEGVDEFTDHSTFLGFESLSVNAVSNSHTMAYAIEKFAHGGLVHNKTMELFNERHPREFDNFLGMNMTYTRGGMAELWTLFEEHAFREDKHSKTCIGWAGLLVGGGGGSLVSTCVVEDHNVTFAYTSNVLNGRFHDWRSTELLDLAIAAVRHKKYADFHDDTWKYFTENHEERD